MERKTQKKNQKRGEQKKNTVKGDGKRTPRLQGMFVLAEMKQFTTNADQSGKKTTGCWKRERQRETEKRKKTGRHAQNSDKNQLQTVV